MDSNQRLFISPNNNEFAKKVRSDMCLIGPRLLGNQTKTGVG